MKELHFDTYKEFALEIVDAYDMVIEDDGLNSADVIAKYEDAKEIVKELICLGYDIKSIELSDVEFNGYDDEYAISLFDNSIWCEQAKKDGEYLGIGADVCYILSNCNSKVISKIEAERVYEIEIEESKEYTDCDGDCENCCLDEDDSYLTLDKDDDGIHGFTVSKSDEHGYSNYSFYSTELVDDEMLEMLFDIFGV